MQHCSLRFGYEVSAKVVALEQLAIFRRNVRWGLPPHFIGTESCSGVWLHCLLWALRLSQGTLRSNTLIRLPEHITTQDGACLATCHIHERSAGFENDTIQILSISCSTRSLSVSTDSRALLSYTMASRLLSWSRNSTRSMEISGCR